MTPFDPVALLAMLLTFYPAPTVANLRRARAERPEYFAGATLIGTGGDKIQLPDGRIWDLIFDVGGPRARWQLIEILPGEPGAVDPFALEAGPLTPIDAEAPAAALTGPTFEALVADALGGLDAEDRAIGLAQGTIAEASSSAALERSYSATLGSAEPALADERAAAGAFDPADVLATTATLRDTIEAVDADYDTAPEKPALPAIEHSRPRPPEEEPTGTAVPRPPPVPPPPAPGAPPPEGEGGEAPPTEVS